MGQRKEKPSRQRRKSQVFLELNGEVRKDKIVGVVENNTGMKGSLK